MDHSPPTDAEPGVVQAELLARDCAAAMYENDACTRWLGIQIVEVRPGYARATMQVRAEFLNGHDICHGGLIFTLADSAFAFAYNTYNVNTVAAGCTIEYLRPVHRGDALTAEAVEQVRSGRTGLYDIRVTNRAGEPVAMFRGKSAHIKGNVIRSNDWRPLQATGQTQQ